MAESTGFVDGTDRISRLLADPARAQRVEAILEDGKQMDRVYAMNLAMIRKAGQLTQQAVAEQLGVKQSEVSKLERRDDWLLSTLLAYLRAAGAEDPRIVVTVRGQEVDIDLASLASR